MKISEYDLENPDLLESIVCFSDILGFSNMILKSTKTEESSLLLKNLHKTLKKLYQDLIEINPTGAFKAFTDNIILAYPKWEDGEGQYGSLVTSFMDFQINMILEGYFIRGGISLGDYYGDKDFAYGPALIEAHYLESNLAIHPRIILSNDMVNLVFQHMAFYEEDFNAPQSQEILWDKEDNLYFVNYLYSLEEEFQESYDYEKYLNRLKIHKEQIEIKLNEFKSNSKVLSKYSWSAKYHNYFCDNYLKPKVEIKELEPHIDLNEMKIEGLSSGSFSTLIPPKLLLG